MKCEKKPVTGNKNTPTKLILPQCLADCREKHILETKW